MKPDNLIEHPEGGRFVEVFRSACSVVAAGGETRAALTHIYFELKRGEVSRFHRVSHDEVWNFYQGDGLCLYTWDVESGLVLNELSAAENRFCHVVPAGVWQAAEALGARALVGCSVAPGFEFADFALIDAEAETAARIRADYPDMERFISG